MLTEKTDKKLIKSFFLTIYLKYKNIYLKAALNRSLSYQIYSYKI